MHHARKTTRQEVMKIKKAYIAGAYTAKTPEEVEENVKRAEAIAWMYYLKGYAVFCPHAQTHRIHLRFNHDEIFEYEDWLQADIAWLKDCDVIVFVAGWETSNGAKDGTHYCQSIRQRNSLSCGRRNSGGDERCETVKNWQYCCL